MGSFTKEFLKLPMTVQPGTAGLVHGVNILEMSRREFSGRKKEEGASTQRTGEPEEGKHRKLESFCLVRGRYFW